MDIFSLAVGFVVGAFTGAAGNYLSEKYTDERRSKAAIREQAALWNDIESRFPDIIAEMREDLAGPGGSKVRAFFVKHSRSMLSGVSEPCFEYHTDKHPDLKAAVSHLELNGFVKDITPGNTPMYRMHEILIDHLLKPNQSFKRTPNGAA